MCTTVMVSAVTPFVVALRPVAGGVLLQKASVPVNGFAAAAGAALEVAPAVVLLPAAAAVVEDAAAAVVVGPAAVVVGAADSLDFVVVLLDVLQADARTASAAPTAMIARFTLPPFVGVAARCAEVYGPCASRVTLRYLHLTSRQIASVPDKPVSVQAPSCRYGSDGVSAAGRYRGKVTGRCCTKPMHPTTTRSR
jgi:hypothetical protein